MSETEIIDTVVDEPQEVEVPVLELEFNNLLQICKRINLVDSGAYINMPNHVKTYADPEKKPIKDLITELLSFEEDDNSWRINPIKIEELIATEEFIKVGEKTIYDADRIIIISKMNTIFIIPGEKSIKEGKCQANEIIKLTNLISSQLFLLRFNDVKNDTDGYDLKIEYQLINRTAVQNNHED